MSISAASTISSTDSALPATCAAEGSTHGELLVGWWDGGMLRWWDSRSVHAAGRMVGW